MGRTEIIKAGTMAGLVLIMAHGGQAVAEIKPAEFPPSSYAGQQYVDSKGCVFLRAGTESKVIWVPRVTAGGKQVCGYPPSGKRVAVAGDPGAEGAFDPTGSETAPAAKAPAKDAPAATPEASADGASYVVAMGSFGFASNVDKAIAGAKTLGYPAVKGKLKGAEQGLTTVFAGPFDSKTAAQDAAVRLRAAGFPDAVVMKF